MSRRHASAVFSPGRNLCTDWSRVILVPLFPHTHYFINIRQFATRKVVYSSPHQRIHKIRGVPTYQHHGRKVWSFGMRRHVFERFWTFRKIVITLRLKATQSKKKSVAWPFNRTKLPEYLDIPVTCHLLTEGHIP